MNKHSRKSTKSQQDLNHNLLPPLFSYPSIGNLLNNSRNSRQAQSLFPQHCDCMKLYPGKADCWRSLSSVLHCRLWTGKVEKTREHLSLVGKLYQVQQIKNPWLSLSHLSLFHTQRQVKNVFALNSPEKAEKAKSLWEKRGSTFALVLTQWCKQGSSQKGRQTGAAGLRDKEHKYTDGTLSSYTTKQKFKVTKNKCHEK